MKKEKNHVEEEMVKVSEYNLPVMMRRRKRKKEGKICECDFAFLTVIRGKAGRK